MVDLQMGYFTNMLSFVFLASVLLFAIASLTGGLINSFSAVQPATVANPGQSNFTYLSQAQNISILAGTLQSQLQYTNSSSTSGLSSAFGFLPALGVNTLQALFVTPWLFWNIMGGMAAELGVMFPGSGLYLGMFLSFVLLGAGLAFLAMLFGGRDI